MNDPWQILILDANTASEKDVKAAYARLLKLHRPDTDPEGFRRVREAYEIALASVRGRDAQGTPLPTYAQEKQEGEGASRESAEPPPPVFEPPSIELPEAVQPSFAEVERATASGNAEQLEAALQAFHAQCESARVDAATRTGALERACAGNVKLLASAVPDALLLRLAEMGQVHLPHLVLSAWVEEEDRERITRFGSVVLNQARLLATPEGGLLMARVGVIVGLEKPELATALGNLAFPHLSVDSRTQIMGQLEHETALGRAFEDVTAEMKPFWFERLRRADELHDWQEMRSLRALDDLIHRSRYTWQGWGVIKQLLPPERWAQVESRLRNQAQQVVQSAPKASNFPTWLVIPAVIIGLNLIRLLGTSSSSSYTPRPSYTAEEERGVRRAKDPLKDRKKKTDNGGFTPDVQDWRIPSLEIPPPLTIPQPGIPQPLVIPTLNMDLQPGVPVPTPVPAPTPTPTDQKAGDDYLRALQNGSLFDGSNRMRPQQ